MTAKGTDMVALNDLVDFAHAGGLAATRQLGRAEQKRLGQFMTPPPVARFMARGTLPHEIGSVIRVLDPGAGSGVLAAAAVSALLSHATPPERIEVSLFEADQRLLPLLRRLAVRMRQLARSKGVVLSVMIRVGDFLLSREAIARKPVAEIIISNPPYFKLPARDARVVAHAFAVFGQPNIYGLFMAVCADLLAPSGRWCFISPRSWTNGLYFKSVRRHLFRALTIDAMHVFESRRNHFEDDEILQEAMITWATAQAPNLGQVIVSSSAGAWDLDLSTVRRVPMDKVLEVGGSQAIALPSVDPDSPWTAWTATLSTYGLKVSTGPVVAFRAARHLRESVSEQSVPLLWMQHIRHMRVEWPIKKKREHIVANASTSWMLLPNINMVVMRRFSPKEDLRRITAAPYLAGSFPGFAIGLENHTNYICRPGGQMTADEVRGLAAYLNSALVDGYLRGVAGSTQINATDLRKLPLPGLDAIASIGRCVSKRLTLQETDAIVRSILVGKEDLAEVA